MKRDSFVFRRSFFEAVCMMPPEVQTEVYPAIVRYALDGKDPKGLSDIAMGVFILVKSDIDASSARVRRGRKYGKLGGRPKAVPGPPAVDAEEEPGQEAPEPQPPQAYALGFAEEVAQMKADSAWGEAACMKLRVGAEELALRLDGFLNHCLCECEGKPHRDMGDAKRHFMSWTRKAYPPSPDGGENKKAPEPTYDFNGGFGGQDT